MEWRQIGFKYLSSSISNKYKRSSLFIYLMNINFILFMGLINRKVPSLILECQIGTRF